jgi:hypothetical protein
MTARLLLLALLAAGASGAGAAGAAAAPASPPLSVSTALLPNPAFFGDPLVAQVIVSFDPARVKASSIRVSASFAPFSQTSLPASSSGRAGADDLLVFRYPVQCYTESCLPERGVFRVTLPPVIVTAASIPGGTRLSARGRWQPAVVKSRLPAKATGRITPRFIWPARVPPASYRISPDLSAALLLALALALLAGALLLAGRELVGLRARRRLAALARLTPLEAALAFARESARRPDPTDRRKALNLLAEALESAGHTRLAGRSDAAAWSPQPPSPSRTSALADEVEAELAAAAPAAPPAGPVAGEPA